MSNVELLSQTSNAFKRMAKSVYILSCCKHGMRHASVSSAVCNVSNDPPSLLICMETTASFSTLLTADTLFAVNMLSAEQQHIVATCMREKGEARFNSGDWTELEQQPILSAAQVSFVCRVSEIKRFETHTIVIALIEKSVCNDANSALIYVGGAFVPLHYTSDSYAN